MTSKTRPNHNGKAQGQCSISHLPISHKASSLSPVPLTLEYLLFTPCWDLRTEKQCVEMRLRSPCFTGEGHLCGVSTLSFRNTCVKDLHKSLCSKEYQLRNVLEPYWDTVTARLGAKERYASAESIQDYRSTLPHPSSLHCP